MTPPPGEVLRVLAAARITHVAGIPDNTSAPLFDALADHPAIHLVTVSREGEAFALASGVWLGGGRPLVVVQNTGLLESGDALRGTAVRMGVPLPVLITGRGYARLAAAGVDPRAPPEGELLRRPDVDSVALLTEPTLDAWGIPFHRTGPGAPPSRCLQKAVLRARTEERPVAALVTEALD